MTRRCVQESRGGERSSVEAGQKELGRQKILCLMLLYYLAIQQQMTGQNRMTPE